MAIKTESDSIAKRRLILRDSLGIFSLVLITLVLFAVTLGLFHSFTSHRTVLAQQWSERGRTALHAGKPAEAIVDLRTALSCAPGTRAYELLLAQALGDAGRTEESYQYFMELWETEPGSGPINLQLARLAARRNDRNGAINFYRAAVYGTWEGDGTLRRVAVRLELARYLIDHGDPASARVELLIAGGNSPADIKLDIAIGDLLRLTGDFADADLYYQKAVTPGVGVQ
jgi:tetratricopeptide (TPR) repeat protein